MLCDSVNKEFMQEKSKIDYVTMSQASAGKTQMLSLLSLLGLESSNLSGA